MVQELAPPQLRWFCPPEWIPADSTAKLTPSEGIIGQARAVRALELGLAINSLGFNVFVTGLVGTGRMTAIELHLRPLADQGPEPDDLLYVGISRAVSELVIIAPPAVGTRLKLADS